MTSPIQQLNMSHLFHWFFMRLFLFVRVEQNTMFSFVFEIEILLPYFLVMIYGFLLWHTKVTISNNFDTYP